MSASSFNTRGFLTEWIPAFFLIFIVSILQLSLVLILTEAKTNKVSSVYPPTNYSGFLLLLLLSLLPPYFCFPHLLPSLLLLSLFSLSLVMISLMQRHSHDAICFKPALKTPSLCTHPNGHVYNHHAYWRT